MAERQVERQVEREHVDRFVEDLFAGDLHAQRVTSLGNATDGLLHSASLGIRAIGTGLAMANGLVPKHAIKQVDRFFSNTKLTMKSVFLCWVRFVLTGRSEIFVNFDWTDFDDSDQTMIVLGTQTGHGRSTPLLWMTVRKSELKNQRNDHEDALLVLFHDCLQTLGLSVRVTVVADRGFSDIKLYEFLTSVLGFDYIIRFRGVVHVEAQTGEVRKAKDWVGQHGRMRVLRNAKVTAQQQPVPVVICVKQKDMKDVWCLASSREDLKGSEIKAKYGKRFTIEESFRDVKDPRFGLGLKQVKVERCDRRDKLFLLATLVHTLLVILGKAGQELGMECRYLGASRPGELSLFRQGLMLYRLIPTMKDRWLLPLMHRFGELLRGHDACPQLLGIA